MNTPTEEKNHAHRCQGCGTVWRHGDMLAGDVEAHKCPNCGKAEWRKYAGLIQDQGQPNTRSTHLAFEQPASLYRQPAFWQLAIAVAGVLLVAFGLTELLFAAIQGRS